MGSWTCSCGYSEKMAGDQPYKFLSKVVTGCAEEKGIESAANRISGFFAARTHGTDSEIRWLKDYFGCPGMETFKDTDLIEMMIERELLTGANEMIQCSACGRIFIQNSNESFTRYREEPFETTDKEGSDLLSAAEVSEIQKEAQQAEPFSRY